MIRTLMLAGAVALALAGPALAAPAVTAPTGPPPCTGQETEGPCAALAQRAAVQELKVQFYVQRLAKTEDELAQAAVEITSLRAQLEQAKAAKAPPEK
jgi:hypothetical protein